MKDITKEEARILDIVNEFLNDLICGPDIQHAKSASKVRRVKSVSKDRIFALKLGLKKSSKRLQLGMTIKSLASSARVVNIFNRLGHYASCITIEGLETELTAEPVKEEILTPNRMSLNPAESIAAAN